MRQGSLYAVIATAVASATVASCTPCPETIVDRTFEVSVDPRALCDRRLDSDHFGLSPADCAMLCNDSRANDCNYDTDYARALDAEWAERADAGFDGGPPKAPLEMCPLPPRVPNAIKVTCRETHVTGSYHDGCPIDGRRPAGLRESRDPGGRDVVGDYFAKSAHLEAASVVAFERMHAELVAHAAPSRLRALALRAMRDEIRHAKVVGALAARFGSDVPTVVAAPAIVRSLLEMALENVVEGVVRETFAAAVGLHKATYASDPAVREALAEIAHDECRHGELSFALDVWARARLSASDNARLDRASSGAIGKLREELARDPHALVAKVAGVPTAAAARRILDELEARLWPRTHRAA